MSDFLYLTIAALSDHFHNFIGMFNRITPVRDKHSRVDHDVELVLLDLVHVLLEDAFLKVFHHLVGASAGCLLAVVLLLAYVNILLDGVWIISLVKPGTRLFNSANFELKH